MAWLAAIGCLLLLDQPSEAQVLQSGAAAQAGTDLSTPAMKYFGRGMRTPIAQPQSRRPALPTRRLPLSTGKPFQAIDRGPSVTPYLQLDTFEGDAGVPNYYARVLPQIQQQKANQAQEAQLRQLQQQVRSSGGPNSRRTQRNGGVPTTGHSSQFLNQGGYFPMAQQ